MRHCLGPASLWPRSFLMAQLQGFSGLWKSASCVDLGDQSLSCSKRRRFQVKAEPFRHAFGTTLIECPDVLLMLIEGNSCEVTTDRKSYFDMLISVVSEPWFWVVAPQPATEAPNERSDCYVTPMQHSCSSHHASCTVAAFAWIHPGITHTRVLLHMPTLSCGTCSWSHLATSTWTLWRIGSISIVLFIASRTHFSPSSSCVPISQYPSCYFVAGICRLLSSALQSWLPTASISPLHIAQQKSWVSN